MIVGSVAELRHEAAELVAGVGLRERLGAGGDRVARKDRGLPGVVERREVEAKLVGEGRVDEQESRRAPAACTPRGARS